MKAKTIDDFLDEIAKHYGPFTEIQNDFEILKKTNFNRNECLFVWDVKQGEILFAKGFDNLLGIEDKKIKLREFTDLFHKDDKEHILRIGQAAIHHSLKNPESNREHSLHISHRIKNAKGDYIKVLVHSKPYSLDRNGYITKFITIFSDISFVDASHGVQYKFMSKGLNKKSFHNEIFNPNENIFTERELEIIRGIKKGQTNLQIAQELDISRHTVATHRKSIMKKSGCHSARELLLFCKKEGVL